MHSRLKKVKHKLKSNGLDAILIRSKFNIRYLSGFHGEDGYLLLCNKEKPTYFTDARYISDASEVLKGFFVVDLGNNYAKSIQKVIAKLKIKRLGFESKQFSYAEYAQLNGIFNEVQLISAADFIEEFRCVKDADELSLIKKATNIASDALRYCSRIGKANKTEKEVKDLLECKIRNESADASSFEIIVASGSNSSCPHAKSTTKKIGSKSLILVDLGARYRGYNSDLTRVFISDKISTPNLKIRRVFKIISEAKSLGINKIRPGIRASEVDSIVRNFIAKQGFGKYFTHALGHGVGLEVHEGPRISAQSNTLLEEDMVFTIEPGIYLPGEFGIRLEDMVQVTRKGSKVLNADLFNK